jgi:hypothetical protein
VSEKSHDGEVRMPEDREQAARIKKHEIVKDLSADMATSNAEPLPDPLLNPPKKPKRKK